MEVQTIWSDDGIAIRLPEGEASARRRRGAAVPGRRRGRGPGRRAGRATRRSSRAASARTRRGPCCCRAPPGTRTPLWQQRQRAADLLAVASRYGSFPILVETYRECLSDVFDLDALREILAGVARREIVVHGVETPRASPFASSLLFDYVAAYMYDGDAPLAERRAGALTLDRDLLRELLGQEELRELLDPDALADLELSLQALDRRAPGDDARPRPRPAASARRPVGRRGGGPGRRWRRRRRCLADASWPRPGAPCTTRIAGDDRWIAIEDVARYRDGVGVTPPVGVPRGVPRPG